MYLSIGLDFSVRESAVIGVFDLDNTSWSKRTREFLARAEQNGEAVAAEILRSDAGIRRAAHLSDARERLCAAKAHGRRMSAPS